MTSFVHTVLVPASLSEVSSLLPEGEGNPHRQQHPSWPVRHLPLWFPGGTCSRDLGSAQDGQWRVRESSEVLPYACSSFRKRRPLPKHHVTTISTATASPGTSSTWSVSYRFKARNRSTSGSMPRPSRSVHQPLRSPSPPNHTLSYPSAPVPPHLLGVTDI